MASASSSTSTAPPPAAAYLSLPSSTLPIMTPFISEAAKSRFLGGFVNDCREFQRPKDCAQVQMQNFQGEEVELFGLKQRKIFHPIVKSLYPMAQNIGGKRKGMIRSDKRNS